MRAGGESQGAQVEPGQVLAAAGTFQPGSGSHGGRWRTRVSGWLEMGNWGMADRNLSGARVAELGWWQEWGQRWGDWIPSRESVAPRWPCGVGEWAALKGPGATLEGQGRPASSGQGQGSGAEGVGPAEAQANRKHG